MRNLKEATVANILGVEEEDNVQSGEVMSLALAFIRQYPEGATSKMVADVLGVTERRTRDILKELVMKREIYDRDVPGLKGKLYYPNGKLVHKYLQGSKELGGQIFRLSYHEGKRTPRLQIQERKYSLLDGESVEGAIFIDADQVRDLAEFMLEMATKFDAFDATKPDGAYQR